MIENCCAVPINDMHWQRGKITDVVRKSEMKYRVLLIDYGSLALLQPDRVQPQGYTVDRDLLALGKNHVYIFRGGKISRYGKERKIYRQIKFNTSIFVSVMDLEYLL